MWKCLRSHKLIKTKILSKQAEDRQADRHIHPKLHSMNIIFCFFFQLFRQNGIKHLWDDVDEGDAVEVDPLLVFVLRNKSTLWIVVTSHNENYVVYCNELQIVLFIIRVLWRGYSIGGRRKHNKIWSRKYFFCSLIVYLKLQNFAKHVAVCSTAFAKWCKCDSSFVAC